MKRLLPLCFAALVGIASIHARAQTTPDGTVLSPYGTKYGHTYGTVAAGDALAAVAATAGAALPTASAGPLATAAGNNALSALQSIYGYTPVSPAQSIANPWAGTGLGYTAAPSAAQLMTSLGAASLGGNNAFSGNNTHAGIETYSGTNTATPTSNRSPMWIGNYTSLNPTGEAAGVQINMLANYTGAASSGVTLGLDLEQKVEVGLFPVGGTTFAPQATGGGEHMASGYFHTYAVPSVTLAGCTPGTGGNCPSTIFREQAINVYVDVNPIAINGVSIGGAEVFSAAGIQMHAPTVNNSYTVNGQGPGFGSLMDVWSILSSDDCSSGINAGQCNGFVIGSNVPYLNTGFGTANPYAEVDARVGNRNDTATGWVYGNTLYLETVPTAGLELSFMDTVSAPGMTSAHILHAVTATPITGVTPGGYFAYTIDGTAQTVGSLSAPVTFTFNEKGLPLLVENYSGTATVGFVNGVGAPTALNADISAGVDSITPMGENIAFDIASIPSLNVFGAGGSRPAGAAVGCTTSPAVAILDALTVCGTETATEAVLSGISGSASVALIVNGNSNFGVTGRAGAAARVNIIGADSTSATTALEITNAAGTALGQFRDDGYFITASGAILQGTVRLTQSTPATSAAACVAGQIGVDANYFYSCTATNKWERTALTTF